MIAGRVGGEAAARPRRARARRTPALPKSIGVSPTRDCEKTHEIIMLHVLVPVAHCLVLSRRSCAAHLAIFVSFPPAPARARVCACERAGREGAAQRAQVAAAVDDNKGVGCGRFDFTK